MLNKNLQLSKMEIQELNVLHAVPIYSSEIYSNKFMRIL